MSQEKDVSNIVVLRSLPRAVHLIALEMNLVLMQSMEEMFTLY